MIIIAAYIASAVASLIALTATVLLAWFSVSYYGSDVLESVWPLLTGAVLILLLAPLAASALALIRRMRLLSDLPVHRNICGVCGLLVGLIMLPVVIIDQDWAFGAAIAMTGMLIASPWLNKKLAMRKKKSERDDLG